MQCGSIDNFACTTTYSGGLGLPLLLWQTDLHQTYTSAQLPQVYDPAYDDPCMLPLLEVRLAILGKMSQLSSLLPLL